MPDDKIPPACVRHQMARESRKPFGAWHFAPYERPPEGTLLQVEVRRVLTDQAFGPTLWRGCGTWTNGQPVLDGFDAYCWDDCWDDLVFFFRRWY